MKVPQLLLSTSPLLAPKGFGQLTIRHKVLRAHHARGLSLPAFTLETLAYLITLIYAYRNSYPFSTYGENFFLTIQNVAITLLIIHYSPLASHATITTKPAKAQLQSNQPRVFAAGLGFFLVAYLLLFVFPMNLLALLQLATVPISLFSKIPQITENFRNQSTGQLSVFAVASQIFGCAARLFTTIQEMGDNLVLAGFGLAFVLNVILGVQIWMYWGKGIATKEHFPKEKLDRDAPVTWNEKAGSDAFLGQQHVHPHQPHHPAPSFVPSNLEMPASTSATTGRRWARKVD